MSNENTKKDVTEEKNEKFTISVESAEEFTSVLEQNVTTSDSLCRGFVPLLKQSYADFEGFTVEVGNAPTNLALPNNAIILPDGYVSITAWFNHSNRDDSNGVFAFSRDLNDNKKEGEAIRRIEKLHRYASEGVKFYPTKEAKEGLEKFVSDVAKDRNGKVNWDRISFDVAAPENPNTTLSLVRCLDPVKFLEEVYKGTKEYSYSVVPMYPLPNGSWSVSVNRFNIEQLNRASREVGFLNTSSLGLVK